MLYISIQWLFFVEDDLSCLLDSSYYRLNRLLFRQVSAIEVLVDQNKFLGVLDDRSQCL